MNSEQATGGACYARPSWGRLLSRLFPVRRPEIPEDLEGWAPSYMQTHVVAHLDWRVKRPLPVPSAQLRAAPMFGSW